MSSAVVWRVFVFLFSYLFTNFFKAKEVKRKGHKNYQTHRTGKLVVSCSGS